jgi:hypothetical protein
MPKNLHNSKNRPRKASAIEAQERRKMYRYAKQVEQYEAMQKACSMDDPVVVPKYQAPRVRAADWLSHVQVLYR